MQSTKRACYTVGLLAILTVAAMGAGDDRLRNPTKSDNQTEGQQQNSQSAETGTPSLEKICEQHYSENAVQQLGEDALPALEALVTQVQVETTKGPTGPGSSQEPA